MRFSLTSRGIPEFYVLAEFSSNSEMEICVQKVIGKCFWDQHLRGGQVTGLVAWGAKLLCSHNKDPSRSWGDLELRRSFGVATH